MHWIFRLVYLVTVFIVDFMYLFSFLHCNTTKKNIGVELVSICGLGVGFNYKGAALTCFHADDSQNDRQAESQS